MQPIIIFVIFTEIKFRIPQANFEMPFVENAQIILISVTYFSTCDTDFF